MGEPKATDIPDAAAAERTSLLRARTVSVLSSELPQTGQLTLILVDVGKEFDEEIGAAAGDVHKRTLFAQPHARSDSKTLSKSAETSHHTWSWTYQAH